MADRTIRVRLEAQVAGYRKSMQDAETVTKRLATVADSTGKRIDTASGRMVRSAQVNREAWNTAGTAITAFGAVGVAALGMSAKAAMDWETAWTGVLKTVDGSPAQLAALEGSLRSMALEMPQSAVGIAAVAEAAGQLGVATENVAAFTRIMVMLGDTTNLTSEEAATSIAQLMNVMQTAPEDVGRLGAALVALGNNGASTERDIIQMAQRIGGAANIVGLTEAQVLGLANALASAGIEVEAGGSAISAIMIDISKAVSAGGDDLQSWADVSGTTAEDFAAAWKAEPAEALVTTIEGLGRMNDAGQDVFGTLAELGQSDVRVTRALLGMAGSGDLFRKSLEGGTKAWEDNTALVEEAEKRYDTTEAKVQIAKNSLQEVSMVIGDYLLPMLAGLAEGVADVAQWFAALPGPVKGVITGLGGIASVAALAGGGFLLLFPRVLDTVNSLKSIGAISPRAASGLGAVTRGLGAATKAAGLAGAAFVVVSVASDMIDSDSVASVSEFTAAVLGLADGSQKLDGILSNSRGLSDIIQGTSDLGAAIKEADPGSLNEGFANLFSLGGMLRGLNPYGDAKEDVEAYDQALVALMQSGATDEAAEGAAHFAAEALSVGKSAEDVERLLPGYHDALLDIDNASTLAAGSTKVLTAAQEEEAKASKEAEEALNDWLETIADADRSFFTLGGAYQSVIDSNIAAAQKQADDLNDANDAANDRRRASDKDTVDYVTATWEDYYDGQKVSSADYIAQLQAEVDAQTAWETNMTAIAARVRDGLSEGNAAAGRELFNELLALGPEGAAQVALLADMSEAEFAEVVDLYGQKGAAAVSAFTSEVYGILGPEIDVTANTDPAESQYHNFLQNLPTAITLNILPQFGGNQELSGQSRANLFTRNKPSSTVNKKLWGPGDGYGDKGYASGGTITGPGTGTSDSVPIWASDGEYMHRAAAHNFWGTPTMDAINRNDVSGVLHALSAKGLAGGGPVTYSAPAPQVITVPVESRYEEHAPVHMTFSGQSAFSDGLDYAERRRDSVMGGR